MAQIFYERNVVGPATHAFVIGVGDYPSAKPGKGAISELRTVRDLPSAADSAKLMCDWLIENQDKLAAPLARIEVLISDPTHLSNNRYNWKNAKPVSPATNVNVKETGERWVENLITNPDNVAFFYACGHGAVVSGQRAIFLSDLNSNKVNPWMHHNIGKTSQAFRQLEEIKAGFFFADTCGEFIKNFQLDDAEDSRFIKINLPSPSDRDKVWLLGAASEGLLAADALFASDEPLTYEANLNRDSDVRIGRFTQTLIKGLDGASARWMGNKWMVYPNGLWQDLKMLQRVYFPEWKDRPFEPSQGVIQNDIIPIIYPANPVLPVCVLTDPEDAVSSFLLRIAERNDGQPPWVASREVKKPEYWLAEINGDPGKPLYALAMNGDGHFVSLFISDQPRFDQRVFVK